MSEAGPRVGPALPGEPCRVPPRECWSELEKWVWQEVCSGRTADINRKLGKIADPKTSQDWGAERRLSPAFLETILLHDLWRKGITRRGVRIVGALFEELIDLSGTELLSQLCLESCRFTADVSFEDVRAARRISLMGSVLTGALDFTLAQIGGPLRISGTKVTGALTLISATIRGALLGDRAELTKATLSGAKVDGQLTMMRAEVTSEFNMDSCTIGGLLLMREGRFDSVDLRGATVGDDFELNGAKIAGTLRMDLTTIGGGLRMREGAELAEVICRGLKTANGVDFNGAKVTGRIIIDSASIGGSLLMLGPDAKFAELIVRGVTIGGQLSLSGAKVGGTLRIDATTVGRDLMMRAPIELDEVVIRGAHIGGQLDLTGAKLGRALIIDSTNIGESLLMRESVGFGDVTVRATRIPGQLNLMSTRIEGKLNIDTTHIGTTLLMSGGAKFSDVLITSNKIDRRLDFSNSEVDGVLAVQSTIVDGELLMNGTRCGKKIDLVFVRIKNFIDLRGIAVAEVRLIGSSVSGEFHLASGGQRPKWTGDAKLTLRNTAVGFLCDEPAAWPRYLNLDKFTYESFGSLGANAGTDVANRGSRWFVEWLARDETYSPQPYHQCAKVLREIGHPEMADDVLYAGRERDRREAWRSGNNPRGTGLTLLKWFIGYGYGQGYFRSLWWVAGMVVLGTLLLFVSGQIDKVGGSLLAAAFYSLDLLLPVIELNKPHYEVVLDGFVAYYFAGHKLMGYVLASFLIAGLAGLTK